MLVDCQAWQAQQLLWIPGCDRARDLLNLGEKCEMVRITFSDGSWLEWTGERWDHRPPANKDTPP